MKATKGKVGIAAISVSAMLGLAVFCAGFASADDQAAPAAKSRHKTYIVQMASDPIAAYEGRIPGLAATRPAPGGKVDPQSAAYQNYAAHLKRLHDQALNAVGGGAKVYDYQVVLNGFAAVLTPEQAEALRAHPGVLNVWEDEKLQPQTQSTPRYLRLTGEEGPWADGIVGEDIVIGVIDTGVQPDHPSLADVPTRKNGNRGPNIPYDAPPATWTGTSCQFGNTAFNPLDAPFTCNNKLLKAQFFANGFLGGTAPEEAFAEGEFLSARDSDGHGSHTSTTAGGNNGVPAVIDGESVGNVSGMAPRARVAIYKVCWDAPDPNDSGCASSDSAAAIDQAVADGVDVINFSIGSASTSFTGPDDIAFLFAADAGVHVAVSAGNDGPGAQTIGSPSGEPWVTATGASEDNENFGTFLRVATPAGIAADYAGLEGAGGVTLEESGAVTGNIVPSDPANGCGPFNNADAVEGQIALVIRGVCGFIDKYNNAAAAGASAIVVYNDGTTPVRVDPIVMSVPGATIPGIMIGFDDGSLIAATAAGGTVTGSVSPEFIVSRNNRITGFSSRGPNGGAPDIIKPDLAAPGVGIVAGETLFPNVNNGGGQLFQFLSGTSMASPHTAGVMALLKQAHPDWSPAMVRSALMTTARTNLKKTFGDVRADPFDIGAGLLVPREALSPGLAYDAGFLDYLAFFCGAENQLDLVSPSDCALLESLGFSLDSSDLNLPSIGIAQLVGSQTIRRTVTNVRENKHGKGKKARYEVAVKRPRGVNVTVSPEVLRLGPGESATYEVTFTTRRNAVVNQWAFGSLEWCSDEDTARSPIAVRPVQLSAPGEVRAAGSPGSVSFDVTFGYTGAYQVNVNGLTPGTRNTGALSTGGQAAQFYTLAAGTTLARWAMYDEDIGASNDFDLFLFQQNAAGQFVQIAVSGGGTSEEEINLVNPAPGVYATLVVAFATAANAPFSVFNYNLNGANAGNTTLTLPAAVSGATEAVTVNWTGLPATTRSLAILSHSDGLATIGSTELLVNTQ